MTFASRAKCQSARKPHRIDLESSKETSSITLLPLYDFRTRARVCTRTGGGGGGALRECVMKENLGK